MPAADAVIVITVYLIELSFFRNLHRQLVKPISGHKGKHYQNMNRLYILGGTQSRKEKLPKQKYQAE